MLRPVRHALAHPGFRRLFVAQVVALLGTGLATVALGLLAYRVAGPAGGQVLGTALAIKMVAYVAVAPVAQAALARLPRRAVMVGADLVRLGAAACLPFVGEVWQIYTLILVMQAASATFTPTFQSVVPDLLTDEDDYTAALSLSRLAYDLEAVVSPLLAAAALALVPATALFGGTAVGFAASALLVASVVVPRPGGDAGAEGASESPTRADDAGVGADAAAPAGSDRERPSFGERARAGAVLFVRTPLLRPVLALNLTVAAGGAFVLVQTVMIARDHFGLGEGAVAVLLAANGLGSMAAALALPRVLRSVPERRVMLPGAVAVAAATALVPLALAVGPVAVGALWLVIGLAWSAVSTPVGRLIRRAVPGEDLPAAFAAQFSLSHACWLVTYPLAGWLGVVGLGQAALILAALAGVATVVAVRLWPATRTAPVVRSTA